jgi:anaerobic selenocysteine-containing dehydrogenase
MSKKITRRDFLKIASLGMAVSVGAVNPLYPFSDGVSCPRVQAGLQSLYDPQRVASPLQKSPSGTGWLSQDWDTAIDVVAQAFKAHKPSETAFLVGLYPDHLHDLLRIISSGLGGARLLRFGALGEFESRVTLLDAVQKLFGAAKHPYFDVQRSEVIYSFGANFPGAGQSPHAHIQDDHGVPQVQPGNHAYLVQFGSSLPQTNAYADEWFPIKPGSEPVLAGALARLVARYNGSQVTGAFAGIDIDHAAATSGVSSFDLHRLACIFAEASRKVAVPGGIPLGCAHGLAAAESILALNIIADNLGQEGGLFLMPDSPLYPQHTHRPNTLAEIDAFIERMRRGEIKTLFVHGTNPAHDLPKAYRFSESLSNVEQMISFSSYMDETALLADYIFPDHTPLESWGYQKIIAGCDRPAVSGLQPVVPPLHDTRATVDVILDAVKRTGGDLAASVDFTNELDFLRRAVTTLIDQGGAYDAADADAFWALWLKHGGWWKAERSLMPPVVVSTLERPFGTEKSEATGDEPGRKYALLLFPSLKVGRPMSPWLHEMPETMHTFRDLQVELNPHTAHELGLNTGDVVKVSTPADEVEAVVSLSPGIHPKVIAVRLEEAYTRYGRAAEGRRLNPINLVGKAQNESGQLAYAVTQVKITKTI